MVVLIFLSASCFAKSKEKVYPISCEKLWAAVKKTAGPPYYNVSQMNDANKTGLVVAGTALSGTRMLSIALTGEGDSCTLSIQGAFSGLAHNDKGDLLKRIEQNVSQ
jgi:hypothetical protein